MEFQHLLLIIAASICTVCGVDGVEPRPQCIGSSNDCTDKGITQDCSIKGLTEIPCQFPCSTQILNLSGNSFTTLKGNVFNGECLSQTLLVLDLTENSIVNIELAFFRRLNALQFVFLGGNNLQTLQPALFDGNKALQEIHLENNKFVVVPPLVGTPQTLTKLNLKGNMIRTLEDSQFLNYPFLENLDLSNNLIETFTKYTFENLTQLQVLDLSSNPFSVIPDYGFYLLTSLNSLTITEHKMVSIRPNWFLANPSQENSLKMLNLQDGMLSDIASNAFKSLTNLENLTLQGNRLTTIRGRMFTGLIRLTFLNLADNKLTMVGPVFNELLALESLVLSYNQMTSLSRDMFNGIETLRDVSLANNLLTDIGSALSVLPLLYYVDFSSNLIANLSSNAFMGNSKLEDIQLNGNQLRDVPWAILEAGNILRGSLKTLGLRGNLISEVHSDSFGQLPNLAELDLRDNTIEIVEANSFIKLPALSSLGLSGNHLRTMRKSSLDSNNQLANVYLDGNPWICDCDVLGLWDHLNDTGVNIMNKEDVLCMVPDPGHVDKRRLLDISVDASYDCMGDIFLTKTNIIIMAIGVAAIFLVIIVILLIVVINYKRKMSKHEERQRSSSTQNDYEENGTYLTPSVNGSYHTNSQNHTNSQTNIMRREESHKYDTPYAIQQTYTSMHAPTTPLKPKLYKPNSNKENDGYVDPMEVGDHNRDLYRDKGRKESDGYMQPMEINPAFISKYKR